MRRRGPGRPEVRERTGATEPALAPYGRPGEARRPGAGPDPQGHPGRRVTQPHPTGGRHRADRCGGPHPAGRRVGEAPSHASRAGNIGWLAGAGAKRWGTPETRRRGLPVRRRALGGLWSTAFVTAVATLGAVDTEGPELQTGASRSAARGHPVDRRLWFLHRRRPPALVPTTRERTPEVARRAVSGCYTTSDSPSATCRSPRLPVSSDWNSGAKPLGSCRRPVLPWWIAASCAARNPTSRAISESPGLPPDIFRSSPGGPSFPTSDLTGHPQDRLR